MIVPAVGYEEILATVEAGVYMAFAVGSHDGDPVLAWAAVVMDERSAVIATSDDAAERVAQAVGAVRELREHARQLGFVPV